MFWRREKTVRVELVNPEIRLQADHRPEQKSEAPRAELSAPTRNESMDLFVKLVALASVAIQSALAIYGYSLLTGNYEAFGISMSELEVGMPTLLFHGYLFIFMDTYIPVAQIPIVGKWITALLFILIASLVVWQVKRTSSIEDKFSATSILAFVLVVVVSLPMFGLIRGQSIALEDIGHTGLPASLGQLSKTHVIPTDQGEKQGMVVAATTKYTFLLTGTKVLKIDNDGNKIVRVTKLSAKSDPVAATP